MWQRIQTLFLSIAIVLTGALFFCNVCTILGSDGAVEHIRYTEKISYLIVLIVSILLLISSLVSFKVRMLQMRITVFTAVVLLGFQALLAYDYFTNMGELVFSFTAIFPLIASILCFMASRKIYQDEIMIRAASRLRSSKKR